jgi:DNA-binding FadR family transcriptional regulator
LPSEGELARQLNISRNSVREAVRSLEALGIIEARAGAGLFVRDFSFDPILNNLAYGLLSNLKELNDMIQVRYYLEVGMAELAVAAATDEQFAQLRVILERMHAAAKNGIYSPEDDRAFHQVLWERANNTILPKIIDIFWIILYNAQANGAVPDVSDPIDTYHRHRELADALEKRDLKALQAAMTRHWGYPEIKIPTI